MDCPQCKTDLVMAERQGVEIDHCPNCRGVWLDRGELDKIVQRSNAYSGTYEADAGDGVADWDDDDGGGGHRPPGRPTSPPPQQPYPRGSRRKKSFWEELFD